MLNINSDVTALLGQADSEPISIYRVYYDILVPMEGADEPVMLSDSLDVSAGRDAREAQSKVEEFIMNSGKYMSTPSEFYITGSKRLATTEI